MALKSKISQVEKRAQQKPAPNQQRPNKGNNKNNDNDKDKKKPKYPCWLRKQIDPPVNKLTVPKKASGRTREKVNYYWCHDNSGDHCGGKLRQHKPSESIPAAEMRKHCSVDKRKTNAETRLPISNKNVILNPIAPPRN